jgi:hypothetical protein
MRTLSKHPKEVLQRYFLKISAALLILTLWSFTSFAANILSSKSGNWSSTSTWSTGHVPGMFDNVTISTGDTVTIDQTAYSLAFTVKTGAILKLSAGLTVYGVFNNAAGGEFDANSYTLTIANTATGTNFKCGGTFNAGTGTVYFSGIGNTCTTNGSPTFNNVVADNIILHFGTSNIMDGKLTITNGASLEAAPQFTTNATLCFDGDYTVGTTDVTWSSGTGTRVPYKVEIKSGTVTLSAARTVKSSLILTGGILSAGTNLTISSGSSLTRAGGSLSGTPTFSGAVSLTYSQSSSLITIGGEIPSSHTVSNLTIGSTNNVALATDLTVSGTLNFTAGKLDINSNNLTISNAGSITGYDSTKYIITNNNASTGGTLSLYVANNNTAVTFPVGTSSSYSPAQVALSISSTPDNFKVRVFDSILTSATSGVDMGTHTVRKTWMIDEATTGGSNATIYLGWLHNSQGGAFRFNSCGLAHYTSNIWNLPTTWGTSNPINGVNWVSGSYNSFSPFTVVDSRVTDIVANIKVFLQGPFNSTSGIMKTGLNSAGLIPSAQPYSAAPWSYTGTESVSSGFFTSHTSIVDWILLELRTGTGSGTLVARRAAFLKSDGTIVDTDGVSTVVFHGQRPGIYYMVVRHRNHLAVMTKSTVTTNNVTSQYDFSTSQGQAYGSAPMKSMNGTFVMEAGDADASGAIDASDHTSYWSSQNGTSGYISADFNLDGKVSAADLNTHWRGNNAATTQVP